MNSHYGRLLHFFIGAYMVKQVQFLRADKFTIGKGNILTTESLIDSIIY